MDNKWGIFFTLEHLTIWSYASPLYFYRYYDYRFGFGYMGIV